MPKFLINLLLFLSSFTAISQITLTHNVGNELVERRIFACSYGGMNWARAFTLQDFGVPAGESFIIESGQVGFYDTYVPVAGHVIFNIYEIDNDFPTSFDESKLIGSSQQIRLFRNQDPELYDVEFDDPIIIQADVERILVEVKQVPNFANSFVAFIASTDEGNDESYIKSDFGGCIPFGYYTTPEELSYNFGHNFYITVNGQVGKFVIKDELNCADSSVNFSIQGDVPHSSITWDFGDGNTSTIEKPTHSYLLPGTYTVTVFLTTSSSILTKEIEVHIPNPVSAFSPGEVTICNDVGNNTIDLGTFDTTIFGIQDATELRVNYFTSQANADSNINSLNTEHYIGSIVSETLYARVSNITNNQCYATTSFQLNYFKRPVAPNVSEWSVCDDNQDGIYEFDLSLKTDEILSTSSGVSVSYYESEEDAELSQNALGALYQNNISPQIIYFRMENHNNSDCYVISNFDLIVTNAAAYTPTNIVICDMNETGIYNFDLSQKDMEIRNGQDPEKYKIRYYRSEEDALSNENELNRLNYQNSNLTETIYARLQHIEVASCFAITNFAILVNTKPKINLQDSYVICPDSPNLVIDGGDFETYEWRNEAGELIGNSRNLSVNSLGIHTLAVTETKNDISCENQQTFTVFSSGAPDSFVVAIEGSSDSINLTINATGIGDFEYSLDGINYQTENTFKVFPGRHTVFVRDPLNCRVLTQELIALGYQKFFTPNGDNVNEYWNVIGNELYPNSQLFIYDRYGKLLKQLEVNSLGWDGNFQGKPMPASEYWFRYQYDSNKVLSGHFALKR